MYVNIIDTKYYLYTFFCQITTLLINCVAFSFGLGNGGGSNKNDSFESFKGK